VDGNKNMWQVFRGDTFHCKNAELGVHVVSRSAKLQSESLSQQKERSMHDFEATPGW
jgi:hypothetical protein